MEKRTIIAILLIFVIYWVSSQFLWRPAVVEQEVGQNVERAHEQSTTAAIPVTRERPTFAEPEVYDSQFFGSLATIVNDRIILENDSVSVSFTNRGALINQITLRNFYLLDKRTPVTLIPDEQAILQVHFQNHVLASVNEVIFDYEIERRGDAQRLTFSIDNPETGFVFRKIFTLGSGHSLGFYIEGENIPFFESYNVSMRSGINITEDSRAAVRGIGDQFRFIAQVDREGVSVTQSRLGRGEQTFSGRVNWAAVKSKYFVMSLIPESRIMTQSVRAQRVSETLGFELFINYNSRQSSIRDRYELYLGPVNHDLLRSFNIGKENIAESGMRWLRPLSRVFRFYIVFLYRFIPNYGLVIMFFAFTLKILLSPLTKKSLTAGRKMQKIQPLMREIQAKYKNDPKKQQEELKRVYAEHKVNPLGGCLPILLQMPIFFALYPVLHTSIEFRQATFFGWLTDLSEPDPYWILPILMGCFMFLQQRMMQQKQDTSNMDEKQLAMVQSQKMMMYILPPFMVFIFSGLPSGLVLYWTTFNIFSIVQQYFLNKKQED